MSEKLTDNQLLNTILTKLFTIETYVSKFNIELATTLEMQRTAEKVILQQRSMIDSLETEVSTLQLMNDRLSKQLTRLIQNFDSDD